MAQLHLTKVAFACRDLASLQKRITARAVDGEVRVVTRMRPKRAEELLGGSLFWIVRHQLVASQEILRLDDREDGRIDIVCLGQLRTIDPQPRRAHQGWRYLELDGSEHVPSATGLSDLPSELYSELAALALI